MAMVNPKTRANYEPNSWGGELAVRAKTPERGFHSYRRRRSRAEGSRRSEPSPTTIVRRANSISARPEVEQDT